MSVPVVMPQLGLTMTEGSVSEWLKKPGDVVHKGEMLFVVSTDKADMEVESLDEGELVQIVVEPGNIVPVGTVIAYLGEHGEVVAGQKPRAKVTPPPMPHAAPPGPPGAAIAASLAAPPEPAEGLPASPRARKVARELGVDIAKVQPRGGGGRIVEEDVRRFAAASQAGPVKVAPHDLRRRQVIAERLTRSIQTIPHFSLGLQVRADAFVALRESVKEPLKNQAGLKLTATDLLLKALGMALEETPGLRTVYAEGNFQPVEATDVGLAIAAESGVVAPVVRNLPALDLADIARWRIDVMDKARGGRLSLTDLEGGIGTLSNLGTYRVDQFQAIISPGQSFILAVGKIDRRPWVEAGALIAAQTVSLTLSVDHRVADGALAAEFLERIASLIENPYRLLWAPGKPKNP